MMYFLFLISDLIEYVPVLWGRTNSNRCRKKDPLAQSSILYETIEMEADQYV